ncbi:hypothetical protein TFLX_00244 [Thermoflexales bacterium]|nr:hypothetical protein TFLX_00244 [Thermoflexales bacterium]
MAPRPRSTQLISLIGLISVLLLAFGLDRAILFLREENSRTFTLGDILLWAYPLANWVLAICVLMLFWIVVVSGERSKFVAMVFLVVGLPMLFVPLIYFTPAFAGLNLIDYLLPDKLLYHAGGFIAAIGLLRLILGRDKASA